VALAKKGAQKQGRNDENMFTPLACLAKNRKAHQAVEIRVTRLGQFRHLRSLHLWAILYKFS
jgi:hypothetical protein